MESKRFSLNRNDLESLLKGLLITSAGAGLTYLAQWTSGTDFGEATPLVVAVGAFLVNFLRKFLNGPVKQPGLTLP